MDRDLQVALRRFGARVRLLREQEGITQDELAERCAVSQKFISQLERGANSPSFETLVVLAHHGFRIAVSDLLQGIDPHQPNPTGDLQRLLADTPPKLRSALVRIVKILTESA